MKKNNLLLIVLLSLVSSFAIACPFEDLGFTQGIAEENDLKIDTDHWHNFVKSDEDQIDEAKFHQIIDKVMSVYEPVIRKMGAKLVVNKNWDDNTVNAYAHRSGKTWYVSMFGGLARHKETTPDGFALVVCHELGHHIAGYPTKGTRWASSEGQSDYFATAKCFRAVYGDEDNSGKIGDILFDVNNPVEEKCSKAHALGTDNDYFTCIRATLGGQSLANLLASLRRSPLPKIATPDTNKVRRHDPNHPKAQCRLDTYFHGALCDKPLDKLFGTRDYKEGYCTRAEGYEVGIRSKCWFNPSQAERESFSSWF